MKRITQIITAFVVLASAATTVGANEYQHIDSLATRIQNKSRQLLQASVDYQHTPEYAHLVTDLNEMARLGAHIHELAHNQASVFHLEEDLRDLDTQFHHVVEVFVKIERDAAYGYGHVHGCSDRVKRLVRDLEETIHHMQEDIAAIRARAQTRYYVAPVVRPPVPVYRPPVQVYPRRVPTPSCHGGGYGNRGGLSFGNENFRIKFGS